MFMKGLRMSSRSVSMNKKTIKTIALLCVPYAFFAILSNKRPQDRRPIKYFLPYEKVRLNALSIYGEAEAKRAYGAQITQQNPRGIKGFVRSWMPFGLVLWLDKGAKFSAVSSPAASTPPVGAARTPASSDKLNKRIDELHRSISLRQDRLEVLLLRILAKNGGKS